MNIRTTHIVSTLIISLGMLVTSVRADETQPAGTPPLGNSPIVLKPRPLDLPVVVEPAPNTPQHFLQLACVNCQQGNDRIAAARIRDSARLMRLQLRHATANGKRALERSIRELEALADSLERGTAKSLDEVKAAFARSQHALAYHYQQRAAESRLRQNFVQAGQELQLAADNVAYGLTWVGAGVQTKSRDVLVATRDLGGALLRGAQADVQQLDAQTKALGQEIKYFGQQIFQPLSR